MNVMGSQQLLSAASDKHKEAERRDLFAIDLVGFGDSKQPEPGKAHACPTKAWHQIKHTDLIIIPAVHNPPEAVIQNNGPLIAFLTEHYKQGAALASMCIGSYLLAATGLLNGKSCSTHWQHASLLKAMFPKVRVKEERLITDEQDLITSGGAYAFTNLILYLVEKYGGRSLSVFLAKTFMIDIDRTSQSVYSQFTGTRQHKDNTVQQVQDFIEQNYAQKFTIDQLAKKYHLVRRTLERRFKSATGFSVAAYTQKVRVEAAKKLLEAGRKSITEVMFDCGYHDPKAFRDVFKKCAGLSPLEYKQKYDRPIER